MSDETCHWCTHAIEMIRIGSGRSWVHQRSGLRECFPTPNAAERCYARPREEESTT